MQLNPHSKLRLPVERQVPTTIFQVIQHPHGISPTKPKITKTVLITLRHSPETQKPISITQCLCGRNIPYIYNPNRSWRSAGTRRRFGRRVGTWRESWDGRRGHSHFLGGIQAWGPRFARGGTWTSGTGPDRDSDIACRQTVSIVCIVIPNHLVLPFGTAPALKSMLELPEVKYPSN